MTEVGVIASIHCAGGCSCGQGFTQRPPRLMRQTLQAHLTLVHHLEGDEARKQVDEAVARAIRVLKETDV